MIKGRPRLFYHCYDLDQPSGGQKSVYQHVDALNSSGYEAFAVHGRASARLRWFENQTKVITWADCWEIFDRNRDYIVLPETLGAQISEYPGRKVIFNKNIFYGHRALEACLPGENPYFRSDVVGVMAVSEHNTKHLRFAYPHQTIYRVYEHIDSSIFEFKPLAQKKRRIACVVKVRLQLASIFQTLYVRASAGLTRARDCEWTLLQGRSEREVAEIMQDSLLFLFTGLEEGLGRAPLEATMCGCVVLGFSAGPMKEYLPRSCQFEPGDVSGFVSEVERVLAASPEELAALQAQVLEAREVALQFSVARHQASVVSAWEDIFWRQASKINAQLNAKNGPNTLKNE